MNTHLSAHEMIDLDEYGVDDPDEDALEEEERLPQVNLMPVNCPLTDAQKSQFEATVPILRLSDLEGSTTEICDFLTAALYSLDHVILNY